MGVHLCARVYAHVHRHTHTALPFTSSLTCTCLAQYVKCLADWICSSQLVFVCLTQHCEEEGVQVKSETEDEETGTEGWKKLAV